MGQPQVSSYWRSCLKPETNNEGRDLEDIWRDHFDYFYREYDEFIFPMTIHPDASGRPHALLMHERLIEHINKHEGVEWVTMEQVCLCSHITLSRTY
jgi:peptidoglycan/xylan/chitin deacetylase (PgdA/CDA1 family)